MDFSNVYNQIMILFILMAIGYGLGKLGWISQLTIQAFTSFIVKIAMVAMIIGGMMIPRTPEKLRESGTVLLISVGMYMAIMLMSKLVAKGLKDQPSRTGVYEFALMFSNVAFMGFPVIQAIFGNEAIFFVAIYNIPFNILVYTVGILMISRSDQAYQFDIKILLNPGVIASVVGFLIFLMDLPIPIPIKGALQLLGSTTTPISMVIIGAMLASLPVHQMFNNWRIYIVCFFRVIVWPFLVFIILRFVLHIDNTMLVGIPVVIAGMPVAANAALMVQEFGSEPQVASQCILITTLASVITIPLLALLLL